MIQLWIFRNDNTPNEVILEHSTQLSTCLTRSTSCARSHFESFEPYIQKIRFLHTLPDDGNLEKFTRILAHDWRCHRVSICLLSFFAYCWNSFGPFYWLPA